MSLSYITIISKKKKKTIHYVPSITKIQNLMKQKILKASSWEKNASDVLGMYVKNTFKFSKAY